jgi:DNA-binding GntR family transcriptional regulator
VPDPSSPHLGYRGIADDLRKRILAGGYRQGLPAEGDLRVEYGVSKSTMHSAIDVLVREGLVVKTFGARSRVRETRPMATVPVPGPEHPRRYAIRARPATAEEARRYEIPLGAPMLALFEIVAGEPSETSDADVEGPVRPPLAYVEVEAWPGDRFQLEPPPGE